MATKFQYEARDNAGKVVKGTVSASSQNAAVAEVRRRKMIPLDVRKSPGLLGMFSQPIGGGRAKAKRASSKVLNSSAPCVDTTISARWLWFVRSPARRR